MELDHTTVWYSQDLTTSAEPLEYYPTVEEIFDELSQQSKTNIIIPVGTREINFSIVEPLTDQEEEHYEFHLHINTFTSEDSLIEEKNLVHIENTQKEQQTMVLIEQNTMV